jgi:Mg2+ and Co2+ transporter CorA
LPDIPLENRKKQEKAVAELFNMIENLAYLVYRIDEIILYATNVKKQQPKLIKQADKIIRKLNDLKKTLVQTTGNNYTETPEPEFREKLSKLYGKIVRKFDMPGNSQMKNLKILKKELQDKNNEFEHLYQKYFDKLQKKALKYQIKPLQLKTFDEFVKK